MTWLEAHAAKLFIAAVLGVFLFLLVQQVLSWRDEAIDSRAIIAAKTATATATTGITTDLGKATDGQQAVQVRITTDTQKLAVDLEKLRHANPTVDSWLAEPVPVQLRELAKQRRQDRDRLATAAPGSTAAHP